MAIYLLIFISGCVMGSFFYVVGTRLVKNESIIKPRSHCTYCGHPLSFFDLIPILSFLFLRGKCRYCHRKLSIDYLIYEIFTGILYLISYLKFGISYNFFISLIISSLIILIFITDFKEMIILDSPLVISIILIIVLKLIYYDGYEVLFSIASGLLSFLTMILIGHIGKVLFKKESLGGGDIKFSFIMGMILGYRFSLISLIFSTFLAFPYAIASLYFKKDNEVPFGPFLVCSLFIVFYFYEKFKYIIYLF
jgi:prepilin signal peptidase PulO-like enzyme (type II secretory pathway)